MRKEDKEFTSFITPFGTYCFVRMAEGLRNAGTTFVRMTSTVLKSQISKNLLAYVDDIVVKSKKRQDHIQDLQETFSNLRKGNLKLNLKKYTFGVKNKKKLGCIVSAKGIDPNLDKVQAILNMRIPKNIKDVQKLTGILAALNRFISKSAERSLPIFQALKGSKRDFVWGPSQQHAFEEIKKISTTAKHIDFTNTRSRFVIICLSHRNSSKRSTIPRTRNKSFKISSTSLLCFRSIIWIKSILL
jgi:hypothetical protein